MNADGLGVTLGKSQAHTRCPPRAQSEGNQLAVMSRFPKRTQKPIPVELLAAALEAISELPEKDRKNTTSRVVAILGMMDEHNVPSALEARSDLLMSIQFRLQALVRLQAQPSYRAWSMRSDTPGMHYVHADIVAAAAIAPLLMTGRVASFEPQSFFKLVLEISEARGCG
jgi:hypothetical protein